MSHPAYKPPPALCTKAKVAKGGGVFAGQYGNTEEKYEYIILDSPLWRICRVTNHITDHRIQSFV